MRRPWMAFMFTLALAAPLVAHANDTTKNPYSSNQGQFGTPNQIGSQNPSGSQSQLDSKMDAKKHLSEVDLYLKDALNNARVLYQVSDQSQSGSVDPVIAREQISNIDRALANADKHLRSSQSGSFQFSKIDMLTRDLSQARSQLGTIRTSVTGNTSQLRDGTMQLAQTLQRADDDFGQIASSVGLVRVDQIHVTVKQPVRGTDFDPLDVTSPELRGPGIDDNFRNGAPQAEPPRSLPSPGSTSPEMGPRY